MVIPSKLPAVGTTIFTTMSALAQAHGAINLAQGFPNFDPPTELIDLVYAHLRAGHNQYAPMPGLLLLRERLADEIESRYQRDTDPLEEITITAGATQGIYSAISAFVRPKEEVILLEPAYDSYGPAVEVNGGIPVPYVMQAPDFRVDWEAINDLITPHTRMIVLNTPHNPTGTVLTEEDWAALEAIVDGTDILILSDEVYEHLIYDGRRHASILARPALRERAIATYSFGKTFHSTGWKVGYLVAAPELTREFRKVHQFTVFSVNTPLQHALADFLEKGDAFSGLGPFYQHKRDLLQTALQGSRLQPLPCAGTYFQLYDYSEISGEPDLDFCKWLTIEHGVAAIPVSPFYTHGSQERLIRLCFAKTDAVLEEAAERLRRI